MNEMKLQQPLLCCRACLTTDCRLYDIREYKADDAFSRITDTPVSLDMLPQHVCAWCLTLLRKCADFRDTCVHSQQRLTKILKWQTDTDGIRRCHPPHRPWNLTRTEVKILDCVPTENTIYQLEDGLIGEVKAEPEIEYEAELSNEIEGEFVFKDEIDDELLLTTPNEIDTNNIIHTETTVKETMVSKASDDNDDVDDSIADDNGNPLNKIIEPVLKIECDNKDDEMENNDDEIKDLLVFKNNKDVLSKNKSVSSGDKLANPEKFKKVTEKKQTKRTKNKVKFKDGKKSHDNIKYEHVLEDDVKNVKPVKRGRPRTKRRIKDLRHPTEGYILFDFAAFQSAYAADVVVLSKEEQLEEIACRKKSRNYLDSPFKCEECGKGYLLETEYTSHRAKQHSPNMEHRCDICGMRFQHNCFRQRHQDVHRLKFPCIRCDFISRSRQQAKAHYAMHAGKTFECQHCGKSFNKRSSCLSHVRLSHPENNVVCAECGETFVSYKGLQSHMKQTHPERLKSLDFKCSICSAKFTSVEALNRHTDTARAHADLRPCEQCGENCTSETELQQHVADKHPTGADHCEVCDMYFSSPDAYNTHIRRKHLGQRYSAPARPRHPARKPQRRPKDKPCVCDQCGYIARNSSFLVYHMRSHLAVKPFACAHCPKSFEIKMKLIYHLRSHSGEKPFKCSDCSLAFAHPGNLKRHHKTVHLKQHDRFACGICERAFTTKGMLKMHVKTTHEGMPWPKRTRKTKDTAP